MGSELSPEEREIVTRINLFVMDYIHTSLKNELENDDQRKGWDYAIGRLSKDLTAIELGIWELPTLEQFEARASE